MRTSSIKSLASALIIAMTLTVAAPSAYARASQPRQNRAGRGEGIVRTVVNLLKRIGQITLNGGMSVPLDETPNVAPDPNTPTTSVP